ncbi:hypothetical protein [Streptomyces microflavus]|uniref:hypothetical protein n=1 Tax=Streptomyces microflavus TaxID=1919 RepID=UPI003864D91D|nr:hypothetical protein OG721_00630 [Streptomyces microflavus]
MDFWDDPEGDNRRASTIWARHQAVQVVECAGQFKFAEHNPEPMDAFPAAMQSSFTVVELDFAGCTIEFVGCLCQGQPHAVHGVRVPGEISSRRVRG